jgi:hypothetical protein
VIYEANTVRWKVGDLVLHDADAKRADMLMRVIGWRNSVWGETVATQYVTPGAGRGKAIFENDVKYLHDPRRFAISLPDAGPVAKVEPVRECAPAGRVLVATMRLPVAVRQLPVLVEWLERAYGKGLTMKQDGTFLCFMRPLVGEGEEQGAVGSGHGAGGGEKQLLAVVDLQAAGETAAGAAAATEP